LVGYEIHYTATAMEHLRGFTARERATIMDAVDEQLRHQPEVPTRHRKRMRPNPIAPWELRIGDHRVFYDLERAIEEESGSAVVVLAIGLKAGNRIFDRRGGIRAMKLIEVAQATKALGQYARELQEEPLVLTQDGHAVAALMPIDDADLESISLSLSPKFLAMIERSREERRNGESFSADEVRRELGVE
jgi:mRNA-degrading endonuclease RelE of RelBE toxin-antitoxin system